MTADQTEALRPTAPPWRRPDRLVLAFDLAATALFALEGALNAAEARFDLFGVLVLAFVTALGGGIVRDVLIGSVPPASLSFKRYPLTAFAAGVVVFLFEDYVDELPSAVLVTLDAGGLGLFAVAGARKALDFGTNGLTAVLLGVVTGVGGGVMRDLLLGIPPRVLNTDVYASAALVGAAIAVIGIQRGHPAGKTMLLGGAVCFALRMIAYWQHWNLPNVGF
ncbi:trimeric intracellular cation channel family protein [Conexibacter sp. CPCC 206217]|uniref:trimeric intracellular cation channel family protein n=1 Tax=Conexibacter sp. CPCC 206217 TaxID=3064574 RepID=UPI002722BB45|nr:trimeric intracellular cation channel family protein [Conexibacter sp. CPCC 206217]MDO8210816.1 trimeric intracellular cation channel family protein [Conexibacter sp. CPCC 206217]